MQISQIQALVTKPRNESAIRRGLIHSRRLRFHNDATLYYYDALGTYLQDFLRWVARVIPADKFDRFEKLITYPVPTNELVENIWKNLARVFEGENRTIDIKFEDKSLLADFKKFFDNSDFQAKIFRAIQSDIDSVVVCDLPDTPGGMPYYYIVPTSSLIDIDTDGEDVRYVIFEDGENRVVSMDDEWIRVFDGTRRDALKLISETRNPIGETPAHMVWNDRLTSENDVNRKSPITSILGDLDNLLFDIVSRTYAEMYGKYPILTAYEIQAEFEGADADQRQTREGSGRKFLGPGSIVTNPAPTSKDEYDLNLNPVKFINADPEILRFIDQRLLSDKDRIFKSVVGDSGEVRNDAAKNDKQMDSVFESKQDVINKLKKPLEEVHEWVIETMCRMAYGDKFLDCEVDYGSQFYLTDEYTLLDKLATAKEKKSPDAVISDITHQYFETKYRADSETKKRMKIVLDLDPFPSKNIDDVFAIFSVAPDLIGVENMTVKMHLDSLLQRFERENVPLTQFANQYKYYEKIEIINKTIRGYAKANTSQQERQLQDQRQRDGVLPSEGDGGDANGGRQERDNK
jgi:hypothetical protein